MKKIIVITVAICFVATLILVWGGYKVVKVTGDAPFCGSCHSWDSLIAQTHMHDPIHGNANPKGVQASCTDCHLPHSSLIAYLGVKAKNGIAEGWTTLTKDPSKKDWLANRENARKNYTYDSSCLECHKGLLERASKAEFADEKSSKMHLKYINFKGTKEEMQCTSCHKLVGHKDLGETLFKQKDTRPESWDEWEKQRKEKK